MRADCASDGLAAAAARVARSQLSRVRRAIASVITVSPVLVSSTRRWPRVTMASTVSPPKSRAGLTRVDHRPIPLLLLTGGCQQWRCMIVPMVMSHGLPLEIRCMRLATWNCSMALHRKFDAMLGLQPDIAIICECAEPQRLQAWAGLDGIGAETVWVGDNCNKGLAVFAFNGYRVSLAQPFYARL